jgi:hypothetical protein
MRWASWRTRGRPGLVKEKGRKKGRKEGERKREKKVSVYAARK